MAGERTQSIGARKTVTVLFADLVESTAMAEALDPEVLAGRLATYFERMRSIIESHGGTVEKFIGDAVVGVFGVPVLHEDDALRAVRASLEMQAATTELKLHARIGINTGEVVAGVSGGTSVALGHPVNMAARLEQAADHDTILMGQSTLALVEDRVQARELGPLAVKGSVEPIPAWLVDGLLDSAPRGWQGGTPFVGRQPEVAAVESSFESAVREDSCIVVTVVAPPGLGKSRLASEATARLASRARTAVGRCIPYGEGTTYAPVVEIIRQLDAKDGSATLEEALSSEADGQQVLGQLRALVGGTALSSPEETAWAFRRLLEAMATHRPVVVVFDDIHWADSSLLDLIDYVATFSAGYPLLLICLARPDLFESRPDWTGSRPNSRTIRLLPLTPEETDALLPVDVQAAELRRRIVEAAGGVPLFVEQMAALQQGTGVVQVPASVRALMAARVDQLDPAERSILEIGAVEGETFRRTTVGALLPARVGTSLAGQLMGLIRRDFIRPERLSGSGDAFRFSHALLRDAVYSLMPRRRRAELHERYADLLEGADGPVDQEMVGHQLETAYREHLALGDEHASVKSLGIRAGDALYAASRRAATRKDWRRTIDLLTRSAELLTLDPGRRAAVLPDLITAYVALPDLERADSAYRSALEEGRLAGNEAVTRRAEMASADMDVFQDRPGWQARASRAAESAIAFFSDPPDALVLGRAHLLKAFADGAVSMGRMIEELKIAHSYALRAGDDLLLVETWDELGGAMLSGRTPYTEVLEFVRQERAWASARGIPFAEADAMLGEAYALVAAGEVNAARELLAAVKALFASLPGVVSQHGESYNLAAQLERDAGNASAAEGEYRQAVKLFDTPTTVRWWRTAAVSLANTLLDQGRVDDADALLAEMRSRGEASHIHQLATEEMANARLAAARGDTARALELGSQAVAAIAGSDWIVREAHLREQFAEILLATGDVDTARTELAKSANLLAEKGYAAAETRVRDRLAALA